MSKNKTIIQKCDICGGGDIFEKYKGSMEVKRIFSYQF